LSNRGKESRFSATNRKKQFAVAGDATGEFDTEGEQWLCTITTLGFLAAARRD